LSRVVKRVYRVTADPVKDTKQFMDELERVLNQLMEEEQEEESVALTDIDPTFADVTDSRAMGVVYKNKESTMKVVVISVELSA